MIPYVQAERVNAHVNATTTYRVDAELYGRADFWTCALGAGDCEDYALAKRAALLELGADPAALRLATCWVETGEYHALLIVTTSQGEWALDNRHPLPMRRQDLERLGYRWHLIQEGPQWFELV